MPHNFRHIVERLALLTDNERHKVLWIFDITRRVRLGFSGPGGVGVKIKKT